MKMQISFLIKKRYDNKQIFEIKKKQISTIEASQTCSNNENIDNIWDED